LSGIREALMNLKRAVGRLEDAAGNAESALAGRQRDMFAAAQVQQQPRATRPGTGTLSGDSTIIAERLDKAIKRVEELLEG
jgi:hypothetical protein